MKPITLTNNTYPFGSVLGGRNGNTSDYRFGNGGQEKVDEIHGISNHYTAEYWEMDPRVCKRWNIDPVYKSWQSGYSILGNNPIIFIDPLGLSEDWYKDKEGRIMWDKEQGDIGCTIERNGNTWTNIGKSLTIETKSDIKAPSDIPLASDESVKGNKLTNQYTITGHYYSDGSFSHFTTDFTRSTGVSVDGTEGTSNVEGKINYVSDISKQKNGSYYGYFEQHTQVPYLVSKGLAEVTGGPLVDVNVSAHITIGSNGLLDVAIGHGTFPSVDMSISYNNGCNIETINVYSFWQCSFTLTHCTQTSPGYLRAYIDNSYTLKALELFKNLNDIYKCTNKKWVHFTGYTAGDKLYNPITNTRLNK